RRPARTRRQAGGPYMARARIIITSRKIAAPAVNMTAPISALAAAWSALGCRADWRSAHNEASGTAKAAKALVSGIDDGGQKGSGRSGVRASNARDVPARRARPAGVDGGAIGKIYRRADVSMQAACPRAITRAGTARNVQRGGKRRTRPRVPFPSARAR